MVLPSRMLRSSRFLRVTAVTAAVAAAVLGLTTWWTLEPDLTNRLRDDAFYEYLWAVDVAAGGGGEVSSGVSTSGVQWLWTLALAALAWFVWRAGCCGVHLDIFKILQATARKVQR